MATIELRNVRKKFGKHEVIHGIDLAIAEREFVAFVGPSGCGKSTLLRMIAGLEELSEGELLIDGKAAQQVPPAKRGLAMVFQNYALYPHMTVAENMSFSLRLQGLSKAARDEKVLAVARLLGMEALLDRKPRELSGGQSQRVALGRAMVRQPRAFLLDEPLSNLDAALKAQMRLELVRLHRELKTTMIYVTHDQVEAMTMADRIVVMNGGKVEQTGSPLQLYQKPASLFVAGFIGAPKMNFLDATPGAANEKGMPLTLLNGRVIEAAAGWISAKPGEQLKLGIRPEHITLDPSGELMGQITALEHLGSRTYLHARLSETVTLAVETAGDTSIREGDRQAFHLRPDFFHLFDASGQRLAHKGDKV
ncbi:MAG TPA: sn-glycerol-3-phosphate ABC transporter ATP-binding protein UgpC [Bryobacteraceae bacterium]|nr:sn-glycerol-3-phosphate ABC transporter ATP-binding protein UgpC [Bryobacteraceae bacterium]